MCNCFVSLLTFCCETKCDITGGEMQLQQLDGGLSQKRTVGSQCARPVSCKVLFKSSPTNMKVVGRPESQLFLWNSDTFQNNFKVHGLANILFTPKCIQISTTFLRNWTNNFNRQPVLFSIMIKQPARWTAGFFSDKQYEVQHVSREVAPVKMF